MKSDARPSHAVPDTAHMRSPTRQRASTSQRSVQEVPKLAHGRSQVPLVSPSRLCALPAARNVSVAHHVPVARDVPAARKVPVARDARPTQQRTPVHSIPVARTLQHRTPVSSHSDVRHARPRYPARQAISRSPKVPSQTAQRSPARQCAKSPSHYHEAVQSRPRPVLTDKCPRTAAHSRPTVPHQVTARPRIQPSTPHLKPNPARHTPSPSPTRAPAHAPAPTRPHLLLRATAPACPRHNSRRPMRAQNSCCARFFHARPITGIIARSPARSAPQSPTRSRTSFNGASGGQVIVSFPSPQAQYSALAGGGKVSRQV
ncbi:uncharacterized protein [Palaemon carinicauda]|uniref:uncharacterized protein n=1 Tax=Palaemon carinicauda TaxID=392227 RepID=UPI0035B61882